MTAKFKFRGSPAAHVSKDAQLVDKLNDVMNQSLSELPPSVGRTLVAESISSDQLVALNQNANKLETVLQQVTQALGYDSNDTLTVVQENAAIQGAMLATDASALWGRKISMPSSDSTRSVVLATESPDYLGRRVTLAAEAFDNRESRSAVLYTMAYNYSVARQDEFGETVWPTLLLPADQVGFGIVVNRLTVHKGAQHKVDGAATDWKKIDLMRAGADHTVLLKQKNRVVPVVRVASADKFVDSAIIAPYAYTEEDANFQTAPLAVGKVINLLGISQTDASLDGGLNNQTDSLDPAMSLEAIYLATATTPDAIKLSTLSLDGANFTYAPQGIDRRRVLAFRHKLRLSAATKNVDGTNLTDLAVLATQNLVAEVEIGMSGEANLETGTAEVYFNSLRLVKVLTNTGVELVAGNAHYDAIAAALATARVVGWDVQAYRVNMNMRERGQFIDRTQFTQLYEVPLLSPITAQRPINTDGAMDAGDFEALVTATRFRIMNDGVTAILSCFQRLYDHVSNSRGSNDRPEGLGASRFHVIPTCYAPAAYDMTNLVDSLTSADRIEDLHAAFVNIVRDHGIRMLVESEYMSAAAALGMQGLPTLIVATDPEIARYMMTTGDLRTMSDRFNFRIVSTVDRRMKGKMFITFGVFDEQRNQAPNLLNWGNLVYAPEAVLSAPIPRGESMARETIVQPRYLFVNHLPVATMLTFNNLSSVFQKIAVWMKTIP